MGSQSGILRITSDDQMTAMLRPSAPVDAIAVDDDAIYDVTAAGAGMAVMSMPKDGGPSQVLVAEKHITAFAVDADNIYFARSAFDAATNAVQSAILRMPKRGGTVFALADDDAQINRIALDATNVYWIDDGGRLETAGKAGGEPDL